MSAVPIGGQLDEYTRRLDRPRAAVMSESVSVTNAAMNPNIYFGRPVVDIDGHRLGSVGEVFVDSCSGAAAWLIVAAGLFGSREHLAPVDGIRFDGDNLVLPFGVSILRGAPGLAAGHLLTWDLCSALGKYYEPFLTGERLAFPLR